MDSTKTLPASWYCSQNLFHLEQRAVFYKAWYLLGPIPRFAVDHDVDYELAGVAIHVHHDGNESFSVTRIADVGLSTILYGAVIMTSCIGLPTPALRDSNRPRVCDHLAVGAVFRRMVPVFPPGAACQL